MKVLLPDLVLESVFAIDLAKLRARGFTGLLIDLDNTIVPWESSQITEDFAQWIHRAKEEGFSVCLVTNALEKRTDFFAKLLDIPAVGRAWKPLNRAFVQGLEKINLPPDQVIVVGDQLFTDVLGGNRLGLYTVLVNPLSREELGFTKLVRKLENRVLGYLVSKGKLTEQSLQVRRGEN